MKAQDILHNRGLGDARLRSCAVGDTLARTRLATIFIVGFVSSGSRSPPGPV
jgi:hypothetical protein